MSTSRREFMAGMLAAGLAGKSAFAAHAPAKLQNCSFHLSVIAD